MTVALGSNFGIVPCEVLPWVTPTRMPGFSTSAMAAIGEAAGTKYPSSIVSSVWLNATMAAGNLSVESYQRASTKAAAVIAESWGAAAAAIVSPMASAFKDLASINKQYAGAAKAFAIGEAIINTYLAATKAYAAFAYFPPLAIAAAAAAVAAGIANVVKISSTQFATGGSFTVGGGLTHVDSQLVAFNATPGEMVDVRRPGQEGYSGGVQEIELTGIKANDLFTGDMLRQLFHSLNAGMADGYKLMVPA